MGRRRKEDEVDMNDHALLARRAQQIETERRERRRKVLVSRLYSVLRHSNLMQAINCLAQYYQMDELEMVVIDLEAKKEKAHGLAAENSAR